MIKTKPNFFEYLLFPLLIAISVILCLFNNFSSAVTDGISLWFAVLFPSLFPYFFITAVLTSLKLTTRLSSFLSPFTRRAFNVGGACGYALLISLISGYPLGAKTIADLKERGIIGENESIRAAALCSTSSPTFLLGSVGSVMFCSIKFGVLLFISHIVSCFIVGFIFSFYKRKDRPKNTTPPDSTIDQDNLLYESVYSAVISVLVVGGLITLFYLLTEILLYFNLLTPLTDLFSLLLGNETLGKGFALGLFECTKGLKILSLDKTSILSLPLTAFICGFGGLSVIVQSVSHLKKAKIKTAPFLVAKLTQAVIGFLIALIFSMLFL